MGVFIASEAVDTPSVFLPFLTLLPLKCVNFGTLIQNSMSIVYFKLLTRVGVFSFIKLHVSNF